MRFTFLSSLVLLGLFATGTAFAADLVDLSKTPWGSSRKNTAKAIGITLPKNVTENSGLVVKGFELQKYDGTMGYIFSQDKLSEVYFRVGSDTNKNFSIKAATALRDRLTHQFNRNYGERVVVDAPCINQLGCTYSYWRMNDKTDIALFYTENMDSRNIAVCYLKKRETITDQLFQPDQIPGALLGPDGMFGPGAMSGSDGLFGPGSGNTSGPLPSGGGGQTSRDSARPARSAADSMFGPAGGAERGGRLGNGPDVGSLPSPVAP